MLVHAIMPASRVNGPGLRCVVFVQGCNFRLSGMLEYSEPRFSWDLTSQL